MQWVMGALRASLSGADVTVDANLGDMRLIGQIVRGSWKLRLIRFNTSDNTTGTCDFIVGNMPNDRHYWRHGRAFRWRKADYPMAPLVLTLVLGPLMERSFRQTFIAEQGNVMAFVERPLSATFIALSAIFFLLPLPKQLKRFKRSNAAA